MSRTFQSKKACKQCGGFERYLNDKRCVACARSKANKDFVAVKSVNTISENKKRRDDAKLAGNERYLSLTKCPKHDCKSQQNFSVLQGTWRYVSNSDCCECNIRRVQVHKENRKANNDDNAFLLIDTMHKLRTHRYERVKHVINDKEALKKAIKKWEDDTIAQVKSQNKDHLVPLIKEIAKDDKIDPLQQHTNWF